MNDHADPLRTAAEAHGQPLPPPESDCVTVPSHIDRYRVERLLGEGGFGRVFLAQDEQLERLVAVKVPHARLIATPQDANVYLAEARTAAALDHPHIVPVYDAGSSADCPCYIVSKFIEGRTLAWTIRNQRPAPAEAAVLVAAVAEALHHAHQRGVVHRDVKPGNILLDTAGQPHVADFGLALREQEMGKGPRYAGTPGYMSPEQARGEGHRVDGRSDIFSLGVVFYELLTGRRPFHADTRDELLEQIAAVEARPPRQIDDTLPRELERICLKALAKRASERYTTATDMAEDLRCWLGPASGGRQPPETWTPQGADAPRSPDPATPTDGTPVRIVPKGLRSFDAHDADFFLELLPGPRDRDGLPDSIRFWKRRIDETDTFAVGLIYGPSGCGKSSLVKAGLLPRLADHVLPVYVEATADQTESRLLAGLAKCCPTVPINGGLKGAVAALRQGQGLPAGKKVLVVLDQFEQWLHAKREEADPELVQALRQCDGARVQCVVLIRDDFWMAVTRFLAALEVELVQGHNASAVDLFPTRHAEKVLGAFGRAFGALGEEAGQTTREQQEFLRQAVAGLAEDGKVICVRLALFAEMMKGRPWSPAALREVGGTTGIGATFLEETFCGPTANPKHRLHQAAARAVLKALLPEAGTDIKGMMQPRQRLLEVSGYAARPKEFEALLRMLDTELRLITPTDPEGMEEASGGRQPPEANASQGADAPRSPERFYQLTHDYLVPSLRDWLTRKQRETRRGRAELRLAERAALWNSKPENRHLPAWWEWLNIRLFTRPKDWTAPQRKMMHQAGRYLAFRGLLLAAGLLVLLAAGWESFGRLRAGVLRDRLLEATTEDVPGIVRDMGPYRRWLDGPLRQACAEAEANRDTRKQLHASLALLPADPNQVDYLYARLLGAKPDEAIVLRDALRPHAGALGERLWAVLEDVKSDPDQRLRAACALAVHAPDDVRWEKVSGAVAARLAAENALVIRQWARALKPVGRHLLPGLAALLAEEGRAGAERRTLTGLYADYVEGVPNGFAPLEKVLSEQPGNPEARLALARRQANAAVALAAVGRWEKVSPLLRHVPDPTLRSYLIDRLGPGGAEARTVFDRLNPEREPDMSARRALLLALGEFGQDRLPLHEREGLVPRLLELYQEDSDPGIHGAAGWLLRQWQQQSKVVEVDRASRERERPEGRRWYVNGQGQTMVVVPPGEFEMGEGNQRQKVKIERSFALAAREVTVAEFRRFRKDHKVFEQYAPTEDCPVNMVSWYDAAAYCNWLSKEEGIAEEQWCYAPNEKKEYAEGMKVKANALSLSGYRLPAEWEWEHACRAGSVTRWSMGDAEDLLGKYAWYALNSGSRSRPVGMLRPNDLGLFDLHGNDWEWCQNRIVNIADKDDPQKDNIVDNKSSRLLRGGAFFASASNVRSALRNYGEPASRNDGIGFRAARTFR